MDSVIPKSFIFDESCQKLAQEWSDFLVQNNFNLDSIKEINFKSESPVIYDLNHNKFSINFNEDKLNYHKKKSTLKSELIGRAMGSGRYGLKILDLSAGLAIDAVFLCQLGFEVVAIERNPLIFLSLSEALKKNNLQLQLQFKFQSALDFLSTTSDQFDVVYFDPMFPDKKKSALPKQEMVFFKDLVGSDDDADLVLEKALKLKGVQRIVVKRPMKAPFLFKKPHSQVEGKLIRFDIYGAQI